MISLSVRISQEKRVEKMKRSVAVYYGGLNGTINQKIRRLDYQNKRTMGEQAPPKSIPSSAAQSQVVVSILPQSDDQLDVLFTIFPVYLFESSDIVSIVFTVLLNLAFGLALDYVISITSTLKYGAYLYNLYALLILPVLPNVSKIEYFNTMCLTTLWKYFLIGLFISINVAINGQALIKNSNILQIQIILLIALNLFIIAYLLLKAKS